MAKPCPPDGGNSLCFQAINDKLSKAVPSPWPASLKPPPYQHPPSPSSSRAGTLCGENTRGKTGAEGAKRGRGVLEGSRKNGRGGKEGDGR